MPDTPRDDARTFMFELPDIPVMQAAFIALRHSPTIRDTEVADRTSSLFPKLAAAQANAVDRAN